MRKSRKATIKVFIGKGEETFKNSVLVRGRSNREVLFELKELAGYGGRRSRKTYEDDSVTLYKLSGDKETYFTIEYSWLYSNTS